MRQPPENTSRRGRRLDRLDLYVLLGLFLLAGAMRFPALDQPPHPIPEEISTVSNGCLYVARDDCELPRDAAGSSDLRSTLFSLAYPGRAQPPDAHPPLGTRLIALGMSIGGSGPFGARIVPALLGSTTILLAYVLARRLMEHRLAAVVTAGLLAFDPLHVALSRLAIPDGLGVFFVAVAMMALSDRDHLSGSWSRVVVGGGAMGAAIATTWAALPAVLALILVVGGSAAVAQGPRRRGHAGTAAALLMLPPLVYALSYVGYQSEGRDGLAGAILHQQEMIDLISVVRIPTREESQPWTWMLLKRPETLHATSIGDIEYREIVALGNPPAYWAASALLIWTLVRVARRRRLHEIDRSAVAFVVMMVAFWSLPTTLGIRGITSRHMVFVAPIVALMLGLAVTRVKRMSVGVVSFIALYVAAASALFFIPLATARPLSGRALQARLWFRHCDGPVFQDVGVETATRRVVLPSLAPPPAGWCWLP